MDVLCVLYAFPTTMWINLQLSDYYLTKKAKVFACFLKLLWRCGGRGCFTVSTLLWLALYVETKLNQFPHLCLRAGSLTMKVLDMLLRQEGGWNHGNSFTGRCFYWRGNLYTSYYTDFVWVAEHGTNGFCCLAGVQLSSLKWVSPFLTGEQIQSHIVFWKLKHSCAQRKVQAAIRNEKQENKEHILDSAANKWAAESTVATTTVVFQHESTCFVFVTS